MKIEATTDHAEGGMPRWDEAAMAYVCISGDPKCHCGAEWKSRQVICKDGRLTTLHGSWPAIVYSTTCANAEPHTVAYDGQEDGIFNFSNFTLFTYEVMFDYWDGMTVTPLSYTAHHSRLVMHHERSNCHPPSRTVVRQALQSFLLLLDINYDFSCPCCSSLPHDAMVIVGDAVCMGFRKDLASTGIKLPDGWEERRPIPE